MDNVIFACVQNAGRSQMAAAFFNAIADPASARAISAGTEPANAVYPVVVEVMREAGLDLARNRPQRLTPELAKNATLLVTMGCGDQCPFVPGLEVADWPMPDPKDRPLADVRGIRDDVRARVSALVKSRGWEHRAR